LRTRKLLALFGAALALGLVGAGCGGDDEGGGDGGGNGAAQESGGGAIKIGILSDCEGAFGSFFEPTASGANLALIKYAGGKAAGEKPTDGVTGAKVGDSNIEIVGYGCANDTADKAIEETRRLKAVS
jgi:branched-chain amino acid transport system substrate-binding protein